MCTETECLDGYMDEGFIEDLAFIRRFNRSTIFRKECNESISKTYVIIQDSRKDNTTLMLVDRRKSKSIGGRMTSHLPTKVIRGI